GTTGDMLIERCKIHDTNADGINVSFSLNCHDCEIYACTAAFELEPLTPEVGYMSVKNNYIHNNSDGLTYTIQTAPGTAGQRAPSVVSGNIFVFNPKFGIFLQQYVRNVLVEVNILIDCHQLSGGGLASIYVDSASGSASDPALNLWIRNNQ